MNPQRPPSAVAYDFCYDVDIKDTPFVALSIDFDIPLWTGDKKLKDGLRLICSSIRNMEIVFNEYLGRMGGKMGRN